MGILAELCGKTAQFNSKILEAVGKTHTDTWVE